MKINLLVAATFLSLSVYPQIKEIKDSSVTIGEIKMNDIPMVRLLYEIQKEDTVYGIVFWDQQYKSLYDYKNFSFLNVDNTVDKLYKAILSVFDSGRKDDYKLSFKIGRTDIDIQLSKLGTTRAIIWADDGYFSLTKKELNKLFAK